MSLRLCYLLCALMLAGCESPLFKEPPVPLGPQLTGEALRVAIAGNSVVIDERLQAPLTVYFTEDGEMRGLRSNQYRDRGTWTLENDAVCGAWNNWWGTLNRCWEVYGRGNALTIRSADDGQEVSVTVSPGNVAEL